MISYTNSICTQSLDGVIVHVEVDISKSGLPGFCIVGLADTSVKESRERIFTALKNNAFEPIRRRIVVNMAPADIRKEGSQYDLAIALSMINSGVRQFIKDLRQYMIIGELSLDGKIKGVHGVLPALLTARKSRIKKAIISSENRYEASLIKGMEIYTPVSIKECCDFLWGLSELGPVKQIDYGQIMKSEDFDYPVDLIDIKGQVNAKRAMIIACGGRHNILIYGPPGTGKSMIAKRVPYLLPPMGYNEYIETLSIYSLNERIKDHSLAHYLSRPFRSPHHSISNAGMIGGGAVPKPGEISLAHNGVLFLDELPEFSRKLLDSLRQPMEDKKVNISRARYNMAFPSDFMLIASMNPCPCGFYGSSIKDCVCSISQIRKYRGKLSGPLLDRIDLFVEMSDISKNDISNSGNMGSHEAKNIIEKIFEKQKTRFKNKRYYFNSQIPDNRLNKYCALDDRTMSFFQEVIKHLNISARSMVKLLKVSRTIADMHSEEDINCSHIAEASNYFRFLDYS